MAWEQYDRMAPIYSEWDSFEVALYGAWSFYEKSGAMLVDACKDNMTELIFSKGFREGALYGKRTGGEQKPSSYANLEITNVVRKALQECEGFRNYRTDVYAAIVGATVETLLQERKPKRE